MLAKQTTLVLVVLGLLATRTAATVQTPPPSATLSTFFPSNPVSPDPDVYRRRSRSGFVVVRSIIAGE